MGNIACFVAGSCSFGKVSPQYEQLHIKCGAGWGAEELIFG